MMDFIRKFSGDESGVTSVEYALLAAAAAGAVLIAGENFYAKVNTALQAIDLSGTTPVGDENEL
ncbi:MAG: Flp family type IVb pilin [Sneathiella sp.]|nr:Flp family type IVb pilin [Sneathiella sp.]